MMARSGRATHAGSPSSCCRDEWFTLDRRILPTVTQLFSFLADYGHTLETAFHRRRIDASEAALAIGETALDEQIHQALQARFDYIQQHRLTLPFKYACPSGVLRSGNKNWGATEIGSPWADAVGE